MSKVAELVSTLALPVIEAEGFELVDLEFVKEGKNWFLRFYLDKQDPDPIPQAYFLEVSSPGAERPLKTEKDLKEAIGQYVHLSFYQQVEGEKFLEGFLTEVTDESVTLEVKIKTRKKSVTIVRENIAKARLAIQF